MLKLQQDFGMQYFFSNFDKNDKGRQELSFCFSEEQILIPLKDHLFFEKLPNSELLPLPSKFETVT